MYFYDNSKTEYENIRGLINDYNRICAYLTNNKVEDGMGHEKNDANINYVAMMTDVDLPDTEEV